MPRTVSAGPRGARLILVASLLLALAAPPPGRGEAGLLQQVM